MGVPVLFVDSERAVLDGFRRMFYSDYEVDVALGAEEGLNALRHRGPYAVITSDMHLPGMNGAQFLARAATLDPEATRMVLTGCADLDAAMEAVNRGGIFRFLAKPCDPHLLISSLAAAVRQHDLVRAEKDLLENTLMGSIRVLTDVLSSVSPEASGKTQRIRISVLDLVKELHLPLRWIYDATAMLSQIGSMTLDPELASAGFRHADLTPQQQAEFLRHPLAAQALLRNIPRLEGVAWMISQQHLPVIEASTVPPAISDQRDLLVQGAKLLKLAVTFDDVKLKGVTHEAAINRLRHRLSEFDQPMLDALETLQPEYQEMVLRTVPIAHLSVGAVLDQEVRTKAGLLVVGRGQEVNQPLLMRLQNFRRSGVIADKVQALIMTPLARAHPAPAGTLR